MARHQVTRHASHTPSIPPHVLCLRATHRLVLAPALALPGRPGIGDTVDCEPELELALGLFLFLRSARSSSWYRRATSAESSSTRDCRSRGRRVAMPAHGPLSREARRRLESAPPTFFAVEGALPEQQRCPGVLELLVLREPLRRLASFGRELMRWGLVSQVNSSQVN